MNLLAVITTDEVAAIWEDSQGEPPPEGLAGPLAELLDAAYTRGFQGLRCTDLLQKAAGLSREHYPITRALILDWYSTGKADDESSRNA